MTDDELTPEFLTAADIEANTPITVVSKSMQKRIWAQGSGTVAHVVCNNPEAHRELIELCQKWHAKISHSMYIDGESSKGGYREMRGL